MIKLAMLASGNMRDKSVEDGAIVLILVESQIQEMSREAPALGHPEAIGIPQVSGAGLPSRACHTSGKRRSHAWRAIRAQQPVLPWWYK